VEFKQKHRFIIAFISLLFLLSLIQETYAKYISNAAADATLAIARWNIVVNTQDITSNNNFSNKITPVFSGSSHIASDIIAPTSEGYFDIAINVNSVDVSFTETITLSLGETNTITDLVIIGYSLDGDDMVAFGDGAKTITNNVLHTQSNRIYTYRIFVKWYDGEDEEMDNAADTAATKLGIASVKVDVNFVQKAN